MIKQKLNEKRLLQRQKQQSGGSFLREPLGMVFRQLPRAVDFDNKKLFFKQELKLLKGRKEQLIKTLRIDRGDIFKDSFQQIMRLSAQDLKQRQFVIKFIGEEGVDAGGLVREWYLLLSKEIFNADYSLFKPSSTGNTFQPSNVSYINQDHLRYFKFIGRVVGKVSSNSLSDL